MNKDIFSAKVLPKHTLYPPRNGLNAIGCLAPPSGLLKYFDSGSNLSGMNLSGSYHWEVSWCTESRQTETSSPLRIVMPDITTSSVKQESRAVFTGGSIRSDSKKQLRRYWNSSARSWSNFSMSESFIGERLESISSSRIFLEFGF